VLCLLLVCTYEWCEGDCPPPATKSSGLAGKMAVGILVPVLVIGSIAVGLHYHRKKQKERERRDYNIIILDTSNLADVDQPYRSLNA